MYIFTWIAELAEAIGEVPKQVKYKEPEQAGI
jgi:hypothetical protein